MITKEQLKERHRDIVGYAKSPNSGYGSLPKPLFVGDTFTSDNWNGGDAIIRQFTYWLERQQNTRFVKEFYFDKKELDMVANWDYFNDQNYVQIALRVFDEEIEDWYFRQYLITYYKNRGCIEMILVNGRLINFDEYVWLLNMLEAAGRKFDLTIR